jgi:hypothetical protein
LPAKLTLARRSSTGTFSASDPSFVTPIVKIGLIPRTIRRTNSTGIQTRTPTLQAAIFTPRRS